MKLKIIMFHSLRYLAAVNRDDGGCFLRQILEGGGPRLNMMLIGNEEV